jgi:hypothetical protein
LRCAQRQIDLEAERYKHRWLREIPGDLDEGIVVRACSASADVRDGLDGLGSRR